MKISEIAVLAAIALSVAVGAYLYPQMPDMIASHWDAAGNVNGYMPKFWGLFLMPLVALAMFALLVFIPRIDPLKANIEKFRGYFDGFIVLMTLFLLYVHAISMLWNLGVAVNMNRIMPPALGALLFYCGILIEKAKRNWFIGIRTPWTLSNDMVWDKTHQLGGKLFKITGVIAVFGAFAGTYAFLFFIIPVVAATLFTTVYSYVLYRKLGRAKA